MLNNNKFLATVMIICSVLITSAALAQAPVPSMSFFLTSAGSGDGANLGGLKGADAICQNLAESAGGGNHTWRAYLSTQGENAVNARDRIGSGPWFNAKGNRIAADVAELHSVLNRISAFTAVDERGRTIPGSGYAPNRHDILTGSQTDGTAYPDGENMSCNNWTSNSDSDRARVGHHDYAAWNSAHDSRGCSQAALISSGGDGLFYCFAVQK
ncbi:MAG: hypothetical protein NWP69_02495 [Congregibacter sp.]|nr:hypothetical protein [Congregibacter sp.]